ncbi:MAG TPA: hypothetical protein VFE91_03465 [Nitrososphaerales archaeon]|nr:hypothetical protein [Nitrososphaerales archaeon]
MQIPTPGVRSAALLILGTAVFVAGAIVAISPVPTTVNTMCEEGGCGATQTLPLPALGLGSIISVLGIVFFAWGLDTENWS